MGKKKKNLFNFPTHLPPLPFVESSEVSHTCPVCRVRSSFVIPSPIYASGGKKKHIEEIYKGKLKTIPCKYFKFGSGMFVMIPLSSPLLLSLSLSLFSLAPPPTDLTPFRKRCPSRSLSFLFAPRSDLTTFRKRCPFGQRCFYAHLNPDGTVAVTPKTRPRTNDLSSTSLTDEDLFAVWMNILSGMGEDYSGSLSGSDSDFVALPDLGLSDSDPYGFSSWGSDSDSF
eukprot:TRINITY_DN5865_c0_g1_i15.p1 TRINITY_DN5865_c0_g1~~TRINITY_DN5865_c0_g1_i15.p1  ORF type:complete len:227 (-),score=23.32 TRINITY_DN5865_c0_g1_i15:209-889(-)